MSDVTVLECAAFPRAVRLSAIALVITPLAAAVAGAPRLREMTWPATALMLLAFAAVSIVWVAWWMQRSRTRLEGDRLTQTWITERSVSAADVSQLKLVHWRGLEAIVAPRLLVRRRSGGAVWFHASDPALLEAFADRVTRPDELNPRRC